MGPTKLLNLASFSIVVILKGLNLYIYIYIYIYIYN
uniref:Uncharacterized protein n=1 Tax=Heterorhabditis bacteriophora TaxID=37862 RepID=A0A1I7X0V9_HETBA